MQASTEAVRKIGEKTFLGCDLVVCPKLNRFLERIFLAVMSLKFGLNLAETPIGRNVHHPNAGITLVDMFLIVRYTFNLPEYSLASH